MKFIFLFSSLFLVTCSQSVKEPEEISSDQLWKILSKVNYEGEEEDKKPMFTKKQQELANQTIMIEGILNNNDKFSSILSQKKLTGSETVSFNSNIIRLNTVLAQELNNKAVKVTGKLELDEAATGGYIYYLNDVVLELK